MTQTTETSGTPPATEAPTGNLSELSYTLIKNTILKGVADKEDALADLLRELEAAEGELTSSKLLQIQTQIQQLSTQMNLGATITKKFSDMLDSIAQKIA